MISLAADKERSMHLWLSEEACSLNLSFAGRSAELIAENKHLEIHKTVAAENFGSSSVVVAGTAGYTTVVRKS